MITNDITAQEISYGTTQVLRAIQVGEVFLLQQFRTEAGAERWVSVAKSTGPDARDEILMALNDANEKMEQAYVGNYLTAQRAARADQP